MGSSTEKITQDLAAIATLIDREYETNLNALLTTDLRGTERIGRLVGVSLKNNFADSTEIDLSDTGATNTGARYAWKAKDNLDLSTFHNTPEYLTVAKMYEARGGTTSEDNLLWYVKSSWEGSWFRDLAHAIHPSVCGDESWAKEIAREIALNHPLTETIKDILNSLSAAVPWFSHVPSVTATLLALFIIKTSARGFCEWAKDDGGLILLKIGTRT